MSLSMTRYLQGDYPQPEQQKRFEGTRIDAAIGKSGIEAKYQADQNEINRLHGQIDNYLRYLEHIIEVFYETNQSMINNPRRKTETGGDSRKVTTVKT